MRTLKNFDKFVGNVGLFTAVILIVWDWLSLSHIEIDDEGVLHTTHYVNF